MRGEREEGENTEQKERRKTVLLRLYHNRGILQKCGKNCYKAVKFKKIFAVFTMGEKALIMQAENPDRKGTCL